MLLNFYTFSQADGTLTAPTSAIPGRCALFMKTLILSISLIVSAIISKADCLEYGTQLIWPSGKTISNNSIIVINSSDSTFLAKVSSKNFIYLRQLNGKAKIFLTVIQICDGVNLKQVILKAESPLVDDVEYGLFYNKQTKSQTNSNNESPIRKWVAQKSVDSYLPTWISQPKIIRKQYYPYGCGPDVKVVFSINALAKSPLLIKAVLKNKRTGVMDTCYLTYKFGVLELGHNMCWGEFRFANEPVLEKDEYESRFWLIDEGGKTSIASNTLRFVEPSQLDK